MLADKLGAAAPADLTAKMDLEDYAGNVLYERDKNGQPLEPGYIEFYGPNAEPVKRMAREARIEAVLEQKQSQQRKKGVSRADAERELDALERKLVEAIVTRIKSWKLVDVDGKAIDEPFTRETAISLLSHKGYEFLLARCVEFCQDPANFTKKS